MKVDWQRGGMRAAHLSTSRARASLRAGRVLASQFHRSATGPRASAGWSHADAHLWVAGLGIQWDGYMSTAGRERPSSAI